MNVSKEFIGCFGSATLSVGWFISTPKALRVLPESGTVLNVVYSRLCIPTAAGVGSNTHSVKIMPKIFVVSHEFSCDKVRAEFRGSVSILDRL